MKRYYILLLATLSIFTSSSCKFDKTPNEMNYEGVSFQYPWIWISETRELDEGGYEIICERTGTENIIVVTIYNDQKQTPEDIIEEHFEIVDKQMKDEDQSYKSIEKEEIPNAKFAGYDCIRIDYSTELRSSSYYAIIYIIRTYGKTYKIVKGARSKEELDQTFEIVDNTFKIEDSTVEVDKG